MSVIVVKSYIFDANYLLQRYKIRKQAKNDVNKKNKQEH